jgi:ELMO domain-containing protein
MAGWLPYWLADVIRSFVKTILHWWTSSSEIERILKNERHSVAMTSEVFSSIVKSKTLLNIKKDILAHRPLDVDSAVVEICDKKRIDKKKRLTIANARVCLNSIKYVQEVEIYLNAVKKNFFEWSNRQHYNLLDSFWSRMLPNVRRSSDTTCADWGEVGFQGKDPSTDFRGMGLLGLQQLVYFAGKRDGSDARRVLTDSMHPRRYYPFAATGINITAFVLDLLHEFRLNKCIFAVLEARRLESAGESESLTNSGFGEHLVSIGADVVNDLYCEVFVYFNDLWVKRDPPNVMHFKTIFKDVQDYYRAKYESCAVR